MANKKVILFIREGSKTEKEILDNVAKVFFSNSNVVLLSIPANMNIYMFYNILRKDDFETDPIEVLRELNEKIKETLKEYQREDIAEVYYFFDFDEHSNNIHGISNIEALCEMLERFNNETELGKLYISYPMVEAIRDYIPNDCRTISNKCFVERSDFEKYAEDSSKSTYSSYKKYNFENYKNVMFSFIYRTNCLFKFKVMDRKMFIDNVTPYSLFNKQLEIYNTNNHIFILSGISQFLIDYFKDNWKVSVGKAIKSILRENCKEKI